MTSLLLDNPKAVSDAGTAIYNAKYRAEYEAAYRDQFVAVNILDESVTLGATVNEALTRAENLHPDGLFHVIRVGHRAAFHIGVRSPHADPDRLSR